MDNYDITHISNQWKFKKRGSDKSIKNAETKEELIAYMESYMSDKIGSVKIHKQDSSFQEERTYPRKSDPRKSKG